MAEEEKEELTIKPGDRIKCISGEHKNKTADIIAVYTNSIAIEFDERLEDGSKFRTVLAHAEYEEIV